MNEIASQNPSQILTLLEQALRVPAQATAESRAAAAAVEDRNARVASAPAADWQPPDPAEVDLRDYVRILLKDSDDARKTRGYHSSVRGIHFEASDGEIVRVPALIAGTPIWVKAKFVENGFGRDNKELTSLHKLQLLTVDPATIDGKAHVPLYDATAAFRFGLWTARSFYAAFDSGREPPKLVTAAIVAGLVQDLEPELARILKNLAGGQREMTGKDRATLYPNLSNGGQNGGQNPGFQTVSALIES
jgi:hypothetical protein